MSVWMCTAVLEWPATKMQQESRKRYARALVATIQSVTRLDGTHPESVCVCCHEWHLITSDSGPYRSWFHFIAEERGNWNVNSRSQSLVNVRYSVRLRQTFRSVRTSYTERWNLNWALNTSLCAIRTVCVKWTHTRLTISACLSARFNSVNFVWTLCHCGLS
jgi:hypothetical protein